MKNKRTFKQEMEKKRQSLFLVGLLVSLSLTLMAFEWANFDVEYKELTEVLIEDDFILEIPIEVEIEKPKPKTRVPFVEFNPEEPVPPKIVLDIPDDLPDVEHPILDTTIDAPIVEITEPEKPPVIDPPLPPTALNKQPMFPGGEEAMYKYLSNNIRHTQCSRETGISQTMYIRFVVEKDGSITDVTIPRKLGCGLDKIGINAVDKMPNWSPGEVMGKPVRVRYTLPVRFQLK